MQHFNQRKSSRPSNCFSWL